MRIPAVGVWRGRLAKLATLPIVAMALAACGQVANTDADGNPLNPTGDTAGPGLIGETANGIGFPHEVVTTEGIAASGLYIWLFIVAVVIFVLIEGLLIYMTWRFRRRSKGDDLPEQVHGSNRLEIVWTVIPAIVVAVLFVGSTIVLLDVESESDDPAVVVQTYGFQFGWQFDYVDPASYDAEADRYGAAVVTVAGGGRENAPEIVLPVGEPIRFRLESRDVIHSFYVPSFFFKRDVFPGRTNQFEVTIEKPGVYGGQCAEFCGVAHGDMYFNIRAVERPEYDTWFAEQVGEAPATADADAVEAAASDATADETSEGAADGVAGPSTTGENSEEAA